MFISNSLIGYSKIFSTEKVLGVERNVGLQTDLDEDMKNFIDAYIPSFIAWDLIVFFEANPEIRSTAANLSTYLGRLEADVEKEIRALVERGILKEERGERILYSYCPPTPLREKIREFVSMLEIREKRLLILSLLLQKGAK